MLRRAAAALAAAAALLALTAQRPPGGAAAFAWPTPLPTTAPAPQPTVLWNGPAASSFELAVRPLGVSPDGAARVLVRALLRDPAGAPTRARHGTDFDWFASRGEVQWQTGLRYGGPAAIVSLRDEGRVELRVVANRPRIGERRAAFDTRAWALPRLAAAAVGPHLVRIGWFPRPPRGSVRIERVDGGGRRRFAAALPPGTSSWDDPAVEPGTTARYVVTRPGAVPVPVAVPVPAALAVGTVDAVRGKGAWLAFSGDPLDPDGFAGLDVERIVATAKAAGLRYVELRLAYGAFDEVTAEARPTIDRLVDGLDAAGIAVVGWTVPRALAFDDLARDAAVAAYRTPSGHRLAGLAVDVERGEEFLGEGPRGYAALRDYLRVLRAAVGPHVLLAANVEDPFLERLDATAYPYAAIAAAADVLQPMTYWRMLGPWEGAEKARQAVAGSIARLRVLAGPRVTIGVGAQTAPLSKRGAPPADELRAAVEAGRRAGAIGVIFYDWGGTSPEQWQAIADARW